MRLPTIKVKAKVDTGIKKRSGVSAKEFRKSSSKKGKTLTIKELQLKDTSNTEILRERKEVSLHDLLEEPTNARHERSQDKEEFLKILREIKKEENEER